MKGITSDKKALKIKGHHPDAPFSNRPGIY